MDITAAVLLVACALAFSTANTSLAERSSSSSSSARAAVDRESLLHFKRSIKHDPFHVLDSWNDVSHHNFHCNWTGITCSSKHPGRVISLNITNSTIQGTISPHIGNLSFLHYLNISFNAFTGVIPPTIGDLRKLRVLDLSSNSLSGILPPHLGCLQNLQIAKAFANVLTGSIPYSLPNCSKLTQIDLAYNKLTGNIPKHIGSLTQLSFLKLDGNSLSGNIEESIQNLTSLEVLNLDANHFQGMMPSGIGKLSKLEILRLAFNALSGNIPESLVNCTGLRKISLHVNNLDGTLPSPSGMLRNLVLLNLASNHLKGSIPASLSNVTELRWIGLGGNALQRTIPLSFGRLSKLEIFNVADNNIESGIKGSYQPIPILQALSNCSKLRQLTLFNNKLEGTLPSIFPKQLEKLYLYQNRISGNIPPSIGNLSKLTTLSLFSNNLKGSIPPTIALLQSLERLGIYNNLLEGTIPEEISLLNKSLGALSLSSNSLTGSIPKSIGKLSNLRYLSLSNNSFLGRIPHELGNCGLLEDLTLSFNNLSGEIPREVANLQNIHFNFSLSNNKLSGTVPPQIIGLQMALYIDLSNNNLSGEIGLYMVDWLNAQYINVSSNKFSGSLPDSFGSKKTGPTIKWIDVSYNNFSGRLPSSLYNHSAFEILNFSYNNFEGEISCTGAFKNLTYSSFLHNDMLCGKCMRLPDCADTSAKHSDSPFYKAKWFIIIAVVVGISCMVPPCYLLFFKKKKQQRLNMEEPLNNQFRAISKEELIGATNNLSGENLIGTGSYGAVYSGVLQSREWVAVKVFDIENQQRSNSSFIRECQTLGKVRHRNLTKIITVCCEDNFRAIVLPLITKGNLHDLLHERDMEGLLTPITLEVRMNIILELAGALSYLHHDCTPSIVHCDVKPENVLLDRDMTVKLTDFGIAKIMGTNPESTTLSLRGSVGYIAPEYGVGGDVTSKGDVYSFGIVVLEVMTRKKPTNDMFNGSMSMLEWVSMAAIAEEDNNREKLKSILEFENCSDEELKRMEGVIKLGIVCCNEDPLQRPTMREVENLLSIIVRSDVHTRRSMPNLDDIVDFLQVNRNKLPRESTFSSTF